VGGFITDPGCHDTISRHARCERTGLRCSRRLIVDGYPLMREQLYRAAHRLLRDIWRAHKDNGPMSHEHVPKLIVLHWLPATGNAAVSVGVGSREQTAAACMHAGIDRPWVLRKRVMRYHTRPRRSSWHTADPCSAAVLLTSAAAVVRVDAPRTLWCLELQQPAPSPVQLHHVSMSAPRIIGKTLNVDAVHTCCTGSKSLHTNLIHRECSVPL